MLFYGIGLGFRTVAGYLAKLQDLDALRPPHTSATYFKRTIGSANWRPLPFGSEGATEAQTYTMPAAQGSVSITGQAARLQWNHTAKAEQGAVSVSGQAVRLTSQRLLKAETGSISATGQAAGTLAVRRLAAEQGAMAVSGQDARLTAERLLIAESGSAAITGQDAWTRCERRLKAEQGGVIVDGKDATLTYTPSAGGLYTLTADQAGVTITGIDATLTYYGTVSAPSIPSTAPWWFGVEKEKPVSATARPDGVQAASALGSVTVDTFSSVSETAVPAGLPRLLSATGRASVSTSSRAKVCSIQEYRAAAGSLAADALSEENTEEFWAILSALMDEAA